MSAILQNTKRHCYGLIQKSSCYFLPFHNWNHTLEVYERTQLIASYEGVSGKALERVLIAALFHDTGNAAEFKGHERVSAINAQKFLTQRAYSHTAIHEVISCILATQIPQKPTNLNQKIICDADLFHLGDPSFFWKNELLRNEWSQYLDTQYEDAEWYDLNIAFLDSHKFHTSYGKTYLRPIKERNIEQLKSFLINI